MEIFEGISKAFIGSLKTANIWLQNLYILTFPSSSLAKTYTEQKKSWLNL